MPLIVWWVVGGAYFKMTHLGVWRKICSKAGSFNDLKNCFSGIRIPDLNMKRRNTQPFMLSCNALARCLVIVLVLRVLWLVLSVKGSIC